MRGKSLWEDEFILLVQPSADPLPDRVWHARNHGELLLGLGWEAIEPGTIWSCIESGAKRTIPLSDLFSVEFPLARKVAVGRWALELARAYPGRLEMQSCDLAHRVAILDLEIEKGRRDGRHELLVEKNCECFFDGKVPHEGSAFFYRWR